MLRTRMRLQVVSCSCAAFSLLAGNVNAGQSGSSSATVAAEPVRPATACAQVFGLARGREKNQRRRTAWLDAIARTARGYSVELRIPLRSPRPVTFRGLTLQRIAAHNGRETAAIVRYRPAPGQPANCRPGLYALRVDDSIGRGNQVVGIVDNAVLIRRRDELVYLEIPERSAVQWRMIWHSRWHVRVPKPLHLAAPRPTPPPAPRPPPRPAKPRR